MLDLTAQTLELQVGGHLWAEMILPPRVMLGKTANHGFQSLETMADGLVSVERLKQVHHKRVLVVDVGDSAAPNRKQMHFTGQGFAGSKVYYYPQRCVIHQAVRGIIRMLVRLGVINCLFCVTNVMSIANRQEALKRAIFVIVDANLDYRETEPAPEHEPHRVHQRALALSLVWRRKTSQDPNSIFQSNQDEALQEKLDLMLAVLHGRWTSDRVRHDCIGRGCKCGGSQAACKALIAELMVWLIVEPMPDSPHFSRWTVLGPCAAWFAMACLPHNIFKQAWMHATKNEKPEHRWRPRYSRVG